MDVYRSRLDGEVDPIEPTLVRFNLSPAFFRAVGKVGFHYFLWACPQIGGDEPEFSGIRSFVRNGKGEPSDFINVVDSLVDRIPAEEGPGDDCHAFAAFGLDADLVVQVHFFSQAVGPAFPTFVVKLGKRPESLAKEWRRVHVAAYSPDFAGHDGFLNEL